MKPLFFYHPLYSSLPLGPKHRFPINKYQHLFSQLCDIGLKSAICQNSASATPEQLQLCHDQQYVEAFMRGELSDKAIRKMGFPWTEQLVKRTLQSIGASIACAEAALDNGLAIHLSGGYHHAHHEFGSGFCIFNDWAIAAAHCIKEQKADRVLIFDLDVHQGDGTAQICQHHPDIITSSVHCQQNFPAIKQQSDLDFPLQRGCQDQEYLETIEQALQMSIRLYQPDLVLYNAGADIYRGDELGYFDISIEGVYQRDQYVINTCQELGLPLACALGGGYQRDLTQLTQVHWQLIKASLPTVATC